ncbi:unnamed protein product [marine sediment metagenome]|uniref:Uncharacterized protein n=1 Tax=marine sediment metagenome TaxID=412755 RepID=X1S2B6_9ZZZZ
MAKIAYSSIRIVKTPKDVTVIGIGRSARGSQFYKRAVVVEGDTKDKKTYRDMLDKGVNELLA